VLMQYMLSCVSVTCLHCIKMAKLTIMQTMPHDRPGTMAF